MAVSQESEDVDVARILIFCRNELQQMNIDRIFMALEHRNVVPKGTANVMVQKPASQKSNVLIQVLQSQGVQGFRAFLEICAAESDPKYQEHSRNFLSVVSVYPGYEEWGIEAATQVFSSDELKGLKHSFIQIGDNGVVTVGRDVNTYYDPVHGITLHVPEDSLPQHVEKVEVTIKVGFTEHQLDSDMIMCSATVALQSVPQVLFTKDVFLEIPHSFSSTDTSDLWFVKFKADMDDTVYGEMHRGIFPPEHPYGVIMTNSFSSYMIVNGKRYFRPLKKTHLCQSKRLFCKLLQSKHLKKIKGKDYEEFVDKSYSNSFWFGVTKFSSDNENYKFLISVSQYTPTGFQGVKQYTTKQMWDHCSSFNFGLDKLVFHPQVAEDCGWKACCEGTHEVTKQEAEQLCKSSELRIPGIQYTLSLAPTQAHLQIPGVTVMVTGADKKLSYILTTMAPSSHASAYYYQSEMLHTLSRLSVEPNDFLQQLAYRLPVWKPVAQMLGLTESDLDHIDYDVPSSFPGEKAYQAFLRWMQKEGHHGATYDVLLLALCRATNISDCKSITNAWWYADQYLNTVAKESMVVLP